MSSEKKPSFRLGHESGTIKVYESGGEDSGPDWTPEEHLTVQAALHMAAASLCREQAAECRKEAAGRGEHSPAATLALSRAERSEANARLEVARAAAKHAEAQQLRAAAPLTEPTEEQTDGH